MKFRFLLPFILVTTILLTLVSCKPKRPAGVLSESKMEEILFDYHVAQGVSENGSGLDNKLDNETILQSVFKKHGITEAQFDTSMIFYCGDLKKLAAIYNKVDARLERSLEAVGLLAAPKDAYAALSAEGDTANVWEERPFVVVRSNPLENLFAWEQKCDSTWLEGDELMWRFMPRFLSRSGFCESYADLVVVFDNDSVRGVTVRLNGNNNVELRIGNKEGWLPRSVFGHLIIPLDEKDGGEPSLVLLTNPVLIRFHDTTRSSALSDSLAAEMRADSLLNDSLAHDSLSAEKSGRLSIEELRDQQKGERKIDVVKKKGYTIQPNRRKQQNQNQRRRR